MRPILEADAGSETLGISDIAVANKGFSFTTEQFKNIDFKDILDKEIMLNKWLLCPYKFFCLWQEGSDALYYLTHETELALQIINPPKDIIGGAGNVGATCAQVLANKEIAEDIVLFDVNESVCNGKGLDMYQSMPILNSSSRLLPTANYNDTANSDIVVITAGIARKPGMSRDDLLKTNAGIVSSCSEEAIKYSPNATFIIVSNPLDVMTYIALQKTKLPRNKVIGMAGILDSARFRTFLAMEIGISPKDIQALVLGGHGDTMVPLPRYTTVAGIPITDFVPKDKLDAICERTANGGGEIVKYLQTGSAWYAPATASAEIVEAIIKNQKRILPCTVLLDGEYGYKDVCVGVPIVIGRNGIERIVELKLEPNEKALFDKSASHVKETIKEAMEILK